MVKTWLKARVNEGFVKTLQEFIDQRIVEVLSQESEGQLVAPGHKKKGLDED